MTKTDGAEVKTGAPSPTRCDQGERLTLERIANWSDVECDFETIDLFELRAVVREYLDELRSLSSQLGAGLADNVTDPMKLIARIQWGVDHIQSVEAKRAADLIAELSKTPKTTWGQVRTAVLKRGEA